VRSPTVDLPQALRDALQDASPLLVLGVVIFAGVIGGSLAKRARLPSITGQILVGVLIGEAGLHLFEEHDVEALAPTTFFALGLMTFTIGAQLNLGRLRNAGKRLGLLFLCEALLVPLIVGATLIPFFEFREAALYAALAISTAPATVVALVKEARARGVFVKTLYAAVALNNLACVFLFEVARLVARGEPGSSDLSVATLLLGPLGQLLIALALGGTLALLMHLLVTHVVGEARQATASVLSLLLALGLAELIDASPLLTCMFLGLVQSNLTRSREKLVDAVFSNFERVFLAVFFTIAGMHLSMEHAAAAGGLAVALLLSRFAGKLLAAGLAMKLAGATAQVRRNLGIALIPQAGVAVGLVVLVQNDPKLAGLADTFSAVVLTVVTVNEVIGPLLVRFALQRTGEAGMDRTRLIDFLGEENITTNLKVANMNEAIEALVDLLVRSHQLPKELQPALLASALEREGLASTVLGGGLAIPHGELEDFQQMLGVMALSDEGFPLSSPDEQPVHCIVLLATPVTERERHLAVLAALARSIGGDPHFRERLYQARSPAHAYELLNRETLDTLNPFLEDDDEDSLRPAAAGH
jgi:PTS system fructose-specific IIC component